MTRPLSVIGTLWLSAVTMAASAAIAAPIPKEPARIPAPEAAPIAMLYDMQSGRTLVARDIDRRFAPASITKVMTTYLAFQQLSSGKARLDQALPVKSETFAQWNRKGSTMFIGSTDTPTVDQLLHGITTVSANDGSVVLAEGLAGSVSNWLAAMNRTAQALGMHDSYFGTPNGWPDEGVTFTTARDLVTLGSTLLREQAEAYHHFIGKRSFKYNNIEQPNHDPLSGQIAGADGIKTGFTNQAGYGFLGSAQRGNRRLILVVAASERAGLRNEAARDLMNWGFANTHNIRLFPAGATVAQVAVQGGSLTDVAVARKDGVYATLTDRETPDNIRVTLRYEGPVRAPIAEGEQIAWLDIEQGRATRYSVPLVAAESVEKANAFERLRNGLVAWLR